jgi:hypothetical protein
MRRVIHHAIRPRVEGLETAVNTKAARERNVAGDAPPLGYLLKRQINRDLQQVTVFADGAPLPRAYMRH